MDASTAKLLAEAEAKIGYVFQNKDLLLEALTHRSFARDERLKSNRVSQNERLEFLGDAILSMASALDLYHDSPRANEGVLTQLRANYVCESHLAKCAKEAGLGAFLRVSISMKRSDEVELPSLLCDLVEALVGAIYLDDGFEQAHKFVRRILGEVPKKVLEAPKDAKTEFQEWTQSKMAKTPVYKVLRTSGPPHMPVFVVEVSVADQTFAIGEGPSKKEAAQNAAKIALEKFAK